MKEMPILFSGSMVRAILDGRKTQTRRSVTPQPGDRQLVFNNKNNFSFSGEFWVKCPYEVGDRLWVRETWMPDAPRDGSWDDVPFYGCNCSPLSLIPKRFQKPEHCIYRSTWQGSELIGWKPSIHMPRWASRITLEVVAVRVERLNDISAEDAIKEGVQFFYTDDEEDTYYAIDRNKTPCAETPEEVFAMLWDSINDTRGLGWEINPWVWVVEFKKTE